MFALQTKSSLALIGLMRMKGIGPAICEKLARAFHTLEDVMNAAPSDLRQFAPQDVVDCLVSPNAMSLHMSEAEKTIEKCRRGNIRVISVFEDGYPRMLRSIPDAPPIIYVKGILKTEARNVACIGTRDPSVFGEEAGKRITSFLSENGWSIVSGLAYGIDTVCHEAALNSGGYTIAVLANGLDMVYPRKNDYLAHRIIDCGGALISEQPPGVEAFPVNLVKRDRLQSGLSVATFVMQTDIKGGSMHTVRYTVQQKRRVLAPIPTGIHAREPKSQGILALTHETSARIAEMLKWDTALKRYVQAEFPNRPIAEPIHGREDYPRVLELLNARLGEWSAEGEMSGARQISLL